MTHAAAQPDAPIDIHTPLDVAAIRAEFPILNERVHGHPLVYLDNTATTQKPQCVIDAIVDYYRTTNANVHRGVHHLSVKATEAYETARAKVQRFLGAERPEEIVFVRGTTEAINLVAHAYGSTLEPGDEILVSHMEHHSNIVPWQMLCERTGAVLRVMPIDDDGVLELDEARRLISDRTRIVSIVHVSNALGTINPVRAVADLAHAHGAVVVVDGAQAVPHLAVDVQALGCDFYALSAHKMYGPMGIGALYGRFELLDQLPPYQGGGEMILSVSFEGTTFNQLPHRFEAGTPNVEGAVGLAAAIDYLQALGMDRIAAYERELLEHATRMLEGIEGVRILGRAADKAAVVSFVVDGVHPHDIGTALDQEGIAVRTGHHCAQPVMKRFGVAATVRASFAFYNRREEIDLLGAALRRVVEIFR